MVVYGGRPETERVPVEVMARIGKDRLVTPTRILWDDGRLFDVQVVGRERSYDRRTRTSTTDYTVVVATPSGPGRTTHVWYDGRRFWVERKVR